MRRFFSRAPAMFFCLVAGLAISAVGQAEVIQFPTEELATESVLPVFDQPDVVRNRVVGLAKRFEVGLLMGYALTEPFYNPLQLGGTFSYHINEAHGINIFGATFLEGLSGEAAQLNPIPNSGPPPIYANLQDGPSPKYLVIGSWQYSAYYGKLSFTKDYVMNLHLYGLAGIGMYGLGDASKPVVSVGLGQKFHFTPSLSLRFDLRLLTYMGPDPTSGLKELSRPGRTTPVPTSAFADKLMLEGLLNVGFSYMLPSL